MIKIPYKILPKVTENLQNNKIPRIIWQTFKTNILPKNIALQCKTWVVKNPEYEYNFFTDEDIINFIKTEFPTYLQYYNLLVEGAAKCDLWRLLVLKKYGGVYADLDTICHKPLENIIYANSDYVTSIGSGHKGFQHWCIICVPNHMIINKMLELVINNIKKYNGNCSKCHTVVYRGMKVVNNVLSFVHDKPTLYLGGIFAMSGPGVLQQVSETLATNPKTHHIFHYIYIYDNDNFNGGIEHHRPVNYDPYIESVGTPCYKRNYVV